MQLPFIADILSGFFPNLGITRMTQQAVTVVLVCSVVMLFFLAMKQFCEIVAPTTECPRLHYAVVVWLWLNTISNYMGAVFVKSSGPKSPSQNSDPDNCSECTCNVDANDVISSDVDAANSTTKVTRRRSLRSKKNTGGNNDAGETCNVASPCCDSSHAPGTEHWQTCSKCGCLRLPCTHHCRVCEQCVPMMDHHCPFTRNCVSRHNYAHFFLFLLYCSAGLVYAACMTYRDFDTCWMHDDFEEAEAALRNSGIKPHWTCRQLGSRSLVFLPVFVLTLMMSCFLAFHCFLLFVMDMSTIDFFGKWSGFSRQGWHEMHEACEADRQFFVPSRRAHLFSWPTWQYFIPFSGKFGSLLLSALLEPIWPPER